MELSQDDKRLLAHVTLELRQYNQLLEKAKYVLALFQSPVQPVVSPGSVLEEHLLAMGTSCVWAKETSNPACPSLDQP